MQRVVLFIFMINYTLNAAYNPFFNNKQPKEVQSSQAIEKHQEPKVIIKEISIPKPQRDIKMRYFGFVESSKGRFALVNFDKKNIVLKENDQLNINEWAFNILKITSNYILLTDKANKSQTIYFSSDTQKKDINENN